MAQKIFITGASSGIGEALAYVYAREKAVLGLAARRTDRLEQVAEHCRELGGHPHIYTLDVADQSACQLTANQFIEAASGIDTVIANAGVGGKDKLTSGDPEHINRILRINILGVTNTVIPFLPEMKEQKSGQVVIISSIAGTRGLIGHGGYSASKAALRIMADSWEYTLRRYNITTTTIYPGWIDTEMTENIKNKMWFLMDADTAAKKIIGTINKGKLSYILPWQWNIIVPIMRIIPRGLIRMLTTK